MTYQIEMTCLTFLEKEIQEPAANRAGLSWQTDGISSLYLSAMHTSRIYLSSHGGEQSDGRALPCDLSEAKSSKLSPFGVRAVPWLLQRQAQFMAQDFQELSSGQTFENKFY